MKKLLIVTAVLAVFWACDPEEEMKDATACFEFASEGTFF